MVYDVFISSQGTDYEWVKQFVDALSKRDLRGWVSEKETESEEQFKAQVKEGLGDSTCAVFIINPETVNSPWMLMELGAALSLGKPVVGIISEDTMSAQLLSPFKTSNNLKMGDARVAADDIARRVAAKRQANSDSSA